MRLLLREEEGELEEELLLDEVVVVAAGGALADDAELGLERLVVLEGRVLSAGPGVRLCPPREGGAAAEGEQ